MWGVNGGCSAERGVGGFPIRSIHTKVVWSRVPSPRLKGGPRHLGRLDDGTGDVRRRRRASRFFLLNEAGDGKPWWSRWYSTMTWRKLRGLVRSEEPFCRMCKARGKLVPSKVVDHIVPHRGDWSKFVDRSNLQALCKTCHDGAKKRAERSPEFGRDGWPV